MKWVYGNCLYYESCYIACSVPVIKSEVKVEWSELVRPCLAVQWLVRLTELFVQVEVATSTEHPALNNRTTVIPPRRILSSLTRNTTLTRLTRSSKSSRIRLPSWRSVVSIKNSNSWLGIIIYEENLIFTVPFLLNQEYFFQFIRFRLHCFISSYCISTKFKIPGN